MTASNSPIVNVELSVESDDVVEAGVAAGCICIDYHCEALRKTALPFMHQPDPHAWVDPALSPPQADGAANDEE